MNISEYGVDRETGLPCIDKGDGETLDYPFDFTDFLGDVSDTISSAPGSVTYALTGGITLASQQNTTLIASPFISGGVAGTKCKVTCTITTTAGRVVERSIVLNIKEYMP